MNEIQKRINWFGIAIELKEVLTQIEHNTRRKKPPKEPLEEPLINLMNILDKIEVKFRSKLTEGTESRIRAIRILKESIRESVEESDFSWLR